MKFDLRETARDHIVTVAHRGVTGGNIPCNTMAAYEIALKQGADMIEIDVDCSSDGELVIFHPRMEPAHLNFPGGDIEKMTWEEISRLRFVNCDNAPTQFGLLKLDELLEAFKGRCYINVDKFWGNPQAIYKAIKRHDMVDQVLVKSGLSGNVLDVLEEVAPELPFMPVVLDEFPQHEELLRRSINYVGAEVLFRRDDNVLASEAFIEDMHRQDKLVWLNSIVYDYKVVISGGHTDDCALTESEDRGWGWIADRGFDIIQTDWPMMLIDYLKRTGKYYRK